MWTLTRSLTVSLYPCLQTSARLHPTILTFKEFVSALCIGTILDVRFVEFLAIIPNAKLTLLVSCGAVDPPSRVRLPSCVLCCFCVC